MALFYEVTLQWKISHYMKDDITQVLTIPVIGDSLIQNFFLKRMN